MLPELSLPSVGQGWSSGPDWALAPQTPCFQLPYPSSQANLQMLSLFQVQASPGP